MKKVLFIILFSFIYIGLQAQEGTSTFNFLKLPISSHAAALGGENVSVIEDDLTMAFQNPALLSCVADRTLNLNYMVYMDGVGVGSAAFSKVINDRSAWAVAAQYFGYGKMKQTDPENNILGEFSALVAAGALSFEDGLKLVYARAMAMQKACEAQPSTMAAIIALPDEKVEEICAQVSAEGEVCVAANYNCPGQIVISGSIEGINKACELMKAAGAKRALPLKVGGAFHSPLMDPAKVELEAAINATDVHAPKCPVYQNVDALPHTDPAEIKKNLVAQLTASVRWTQTVKNMVADGATDFTECGPGAVLQGLVKKIDGSVSVHGIA